MQFYIAYIREHTKSLKELSQYVVVDAFFAKHEFIDAIREDDLHVITRLRDDAALWYLYDGPKKKTRGRPRKYAGKVSLRNPDIQCFTLIETTDNHIAYEAVLYSKSLKMSLKILLVHNLKQDGSIKNCKVFACTNTALEGQKVWQYYKLRFQPHGRPRRVLVS